ncbi:MAG: MFS transporter, partial [Candidatus Sericytochromatia bacterium]
MPFATSPLTIARVAVSTTFFVSGSVVASWVPHIPGMQRTLGLNPAQLGLVLLAPAVGMAIAMVLAGALCARFGNARVIRGATVFYCAAVPFTVLAPHPLALGAVLVVMGLTNGLMGVAMNAEALEVERAYRRGINSSFHALYSAGMLVGASAGGLVIASGVSPALHLTVAAALIASAGLWASFNVLSDAPDLLPERVPLFVRPTAYLALLGVGTFSAMLVEGAMADWAGIYLRDVLGTSEAWAAAGFTAFSLAMVAARLTGDWMNRRLGPVGIVRWGGCLALVGLALAVFVRHPAVAITGFGLVGLGMANVVPNFFAGSVRERRLAPSRAIAAVTSLGFAGFLVGPPIIGAIAQVTSLPVAMGVVAAFSGLVWALAGTLKAAP